MIEGITHEEDSFGATSHIMAEMSEVVNYIIMKSKEHSDRQEIKSKINCSNSLSPLQICTQLAQILGSSGQEILYFIALYCQVYKRQKFRNLIYDKGKLNDAHDEES